MSFVWTKVRILDDISFPIFHCVYDKISTGGTKFNISVRGVVRTGVGRNRNHTASAVPSGTKCW